MEYNIDMIDNEPYSYKEKYLDYDYNWDSSNDKEKKRVKIIDAPLKEDKSSFEEKINLYIERNSNKINIIDIKYQKTSVLILYTEKKLKK